jgi:hypothetical protein
MYTTYANVLILSGTALPQATVEGLIGMADQEIDTYCAMHGVSADSSNSAIKGASINLTMTYVLTRARMDGTKEASSLEWSDKTPVDTAIATYRATAFKLLDQYVGGQSSHGFFAGIVGQ